jgi:membrane protein
MLIVAAKRFVNSEGFDSAAILSFKTLFAFVPALALALSIFSFSDYFVNFQPEIEAFLFQHVLPSDADQAKDYLLTFINQAQSLRGLSIVFFIVTGAFLLLSIDQRMNLIWDRASQRNWLSGLLSYLFVLLVGPILLGVSLFLSSYMLALDLLSTVSDYAYTSYIVAFILSCLGLSLTYFLVPLTKVRLISALKAGVMAAIILELIKYSIYSYLFIYSNLEVIYGTLSTLLLLLFWVYVAWTVILFGASVCATLDSES